MVEDAVEKHPDAAAVRFLNKVGNIRVIAQARIEAEMIEGVIAVGNRSENRGEEQAIGTELNKIIQPRIQSS